MQVDLYLSQDLPIAMLSTTSSNDLYLEMREETESYSYSYSIGGRFGFTFPNGVGVKSGLHISRVNRTFSYDDLDGMDTTMSNVVLTQQNKYTMVDVPVLFSYETGGAGGFYFQYVAGMLFNMTLNTEGQILGENGSVRSFTRGVENQYRIYNTDAGASFFASFGLFYVLSDYVDLYAEPYLRYQLSPLTRNDYPIDEKYSTVGIMTGMRYRF